MKAIDEKFELTEKWCPILIRGRKVSTNVVREVLIRTMPYFSTNDRDWLEEVCGASDIEITEYGTTDPQGWFEFEKSISHMELEYLRNSQIMSSYIYGPNGWMNWDGSIGYRHHQNIGKWPETSAVLKEASRLAKMWPMLDMHIQICNGEESVTPLFEIKMYRGKTSISEPVVQIGLPKVPLRDDPESFARQFTSPYRERGCSIGTYKQALAHTLKVRRLSGRRNVVGFN